MIVAVGDPAGRLDEWPDRSGEHPCQEDADDRERGQQNTEHDQDREDEPDEFVTCLADLLFGDDHPAEVGDVDGGGRGDGAVIEEVRGAARERVALQRGVDRGIVDRLEQHRRFGERHQLGGAFVATDVEVAIEVRLGIVEPGPRDRAHPAVGPDEVCIAGVAEAEQVPLLTTRHQLGQTIGVDDDDDHAEYPGVRTHCGGDVDDRSRRVGKVEVGVGDRRGVHGGAGQLGDHGPETTVGVGAGRHVGAEVDALRDRVHDVGRVDVDQQDVGGADAGGEVAQERMVSGVHCAVARAIAGVDHARTRSIVGRPGWSAT